MNIYKDGFIYEGFRNHNEVNDSFAYDKKYPVIGKHNFSDHTELIEGKDYELKYDPSNEARGLRKFESHRVALPLTEAGGQREKNCAFQYAKMNGSIFKNTEIVFDQSELTLDEAKILWNRFYRDCAKHIKNGGTCEMVIWINMTTPYMYGDTLQYISTDAESDGSRIWETKREYFTNEFKINHPQPQ